MSSIWQLGMNFRRSSGGADRYFGDLLDALEGENVRAAAFGEAHGVRPGMDLISLGSPEASILERRRAVRSFGYRFVAESGRKLMATHFALYAACLPSAARRVPQVVHFHGPWCDESLAEGQGRLAAWGKWLVEARVYRRAKRCVTLSRAFGDLLQSRFGVRANKIHVIPGTVDDGRFSPGDKHLARTRLGLAHDERMILSVRRMIRRVGVAELISAFCHICDGDSRLRLHLVGRGGMESTFRELAQSSGFGDRIVFHGYVSDEMLPEFYRAADVSVVPSQALEGFGLSALESLACGTPVMVTPVGGLPEVVENLDRHLVFPSADVEGLTARLREWREGVLRLPDAGACRDLVLRYFSRQGFAKRIREVYSEAMA